MSLCACAGWVRDPKPRLALFNYFDFLGQVRGSMLKRSCSEPGDKTNRRSWSLIAYNMIEQ